MYSVKLETTDVEDSEFQDHLNANGIDAEVIAPPARVLGAGEVVKYTSESAPALVALIYKYFDCGDDSVTEELVASITNEEIA